MKWIDRIAKAFKCGLLLMRWFDAARQDGVVTVEEVAKLVTDLIECAGLTDELRIDVPPPEGLSA